MSQKLHFPCPPKEDKNIKGFLPFFWRWKLKDIILAFFCYLFFSHSEKKDFRSKNDHKEVHMANKNEKCLFS